MSETDRRVSKSKAEPKVKTPIREYVVFVQVRGDGGDPRAFQEVGSGRGSNDVEAIKDATRLLSAAERSAPFFAIAKTRFNVRQRKVETVERESWS